VRPSTLVARGGANAGAGAHAARRLADAEREERRLGRRRGTHEDERAVAAQDRERVLVAGVAQQHARLSAAGGRGPDRRDDVRVQAHGRIELVLPREADVDRPDHRDREQRGREGKRG